MRRHGRTVANCSDKSQLLIRRPKADTFLACGLGHGLALTAHCAVIHYQTAATLPTGEGNGIAATRVAPAGLGHGLALTAYCAVIHYQTAATLPTGESTGYRPIFYSHSGRGSIRRAPT